MKIAVVGDTHGKIDKIKKELTLIKPDYLFFTGDYYPDGKKLASSLKIDFTGVAGNCDPIKTGSAEKKVEIKGKKFLLVHGHQYGVKRGLNRIFYRGKEAEVDMVVFGHTHIAGAEKIEGLWLLNPGSPSQPRLPDRASYAIIEIEENKLNPVIVRM
ncbi:MAG TPA: metallophosphoesterase [Syntrophomonadaceae bacterium]|nr:metallophosphoesterase [Syntrophomonadaceae bacterium]